MQKYPNPEKMTPEDRERLKKLQGQPEVIEEEERPQGSVVGSMESLMETKAAQNPIRYMTTTVDNFGPVRLRSLTTRELFECSQMANDEILKLAYVDDEGRRWIGDAELSYMKSDKFDGQVFQTLVNLGLWFCTARDIESLIEDAVKNSKSDQRS